MSPYAHWYLSFLSTRLFVCWAFWNNCLLSTGPFDHWAYCHWAQCQLGFLSLGLLTRNHPSFLWFSVLFKRSQPADSDAHALQCPSTQPYLHYSTKSPPSLTLSHPFLTWNAKNNHIEYQRPFLKINKRYLRKTVFQNIPTKICPPPLRSHFLYFYILKTIIWSQI